MLKYFIPKEHIGYMEISKFHCLKFGFLTKLLKTNL